MELVFFQASAMVRGSPTQSRSGPTRSRSTPLIVSPAVALVTACGKIRACASSSSWQSLARQSRSIETDYLNGEIVLLGRLHGVPTPVNDLLQRTARVAAREGISPGSMTVEALLARG